jgi:hypothetical protein
MAIGYIVASALLPFVMPLFEKEPPPRRRRREPRPILATALSKKMTKAESDALGIPTLHLASCRCPRCTEGYGLKD